MILAPVIAALSSVLVSVGLPLVAAQAIVGIGLAAGMYAVQRLLTPRQRPPGQEFEAKAGANVPMFGVYGRRRLAGAVMPPVQTSRRVMHVRVLGIDWHDALEAIVIDGERCRFNGIDGQWSNAGKQFQGGILGTPDTGGDGTHVGDPPWTPGLQSAGADGSGWVTTKEYGNNVKVKFYDGRPVQNADATLVAQSGSDAQGNTFWTTDHKGGGVCYAIVDIEPDSNKNLSANPQIEFIVRGRRLWDPRKDTAYGGTGSHSRADKATWEWSDNVALAATDYRLGVFIGGVKMMGIGTPIARLRMDSRIAAANLCDTPRPLLDDEEEPMWRIAAVITNERTHRDNLQIFYDAMAGWETERGGTYRLTAGGPQTPVVAITDADLVKGPRRYKAKKPRSDRYNAVAGKFADPWNAFELQDLPLRTSSEDEAIDGGERLTMTLTLSQVPSQTQAQHLMEIARRRIRLQATATVAVPPRLRDAETMDTVTWASTYHGGAAREFHIQQWKKQRDLTLSWGLVETSADIWDWDPEADQLDPLVAADLPSAAERLATVAGFAIAASYDVGEGGQKLPVFLCSWTPIADMTVDAVIVRYRPVGTTEWSQQRFDTTDTLAAGGPGKVDSGIQAETPYEFEADLATTPPRYTTVQTPVPVTSDPNHVVKKAIITDTVEPGGVDFDALSAAVDAKLDEASANASQALTDARDIAKSLSPVAATRAEVRDRFQNNLHDAVRQLGLALSYALARVDEQSSTMRDAGISVDPTSGAIRITAVDQLRTSTQTQFTEVSALFDAVNALIALRVTQADLDAAIEAVIAGFQPAYRYEFNGTAEGWTGSNATLTPDTGSLDIAGTGAGAYAQSPTLALDADINKIVGARVRRIAGSGWGLALQWGSGYGNSRAFSEPADPDEWNIIRLDQNGQTDWSGTLTGLRIGVANGSAFEFDYIEIGNSALNDLIVGDLSARISDLEIELDAANSAISVRATLAELNAAKDRITVAELAIDAANAAIAGKVSTTTFEGVETRVTTAEFEISSLKNQITFTIGEIADKGKLIRDLALSDAKGQIDAFLRNQTVSEALAYASQTLGARVDANGVAIASFGLQLLALTSSTTAGFTEEATARAAADSALASRATALEATVNNPSTGVTATAAALSTLSGRVTTAEGNITSQASSITSLDTRLDTAESDIDANTSAIATKADSSALSALDSRVTTAEGTITSQGSSITSLSASLSSLSGTVSGNSSAITTLQSDVTSINGTLSSYASQLTSLDASVGNLSASGNVKIIASVSPPTGAISGFQMLVKATDSGNFAEAGIEAYALAGGGGSPLGYTVLVGDKIFRRPSSGGAPVLMVDSAGRFVGDAIGSGQITLYKEFTRAEPGSDGAVGSGTTSGNAGNSYIDSAILGTITIPANPDSIGDGATASDYCPVLFAINATARNGTFGWGFGSAYAMVAAFRVKLDDGSGNTFYSDEGLIACSSSWNGNAVYGFGGNPGSITDIAQIKAGTYNVYLQYRWGPRTENGIAANPSAPNGLPLRIGAKIVALILKR